MVRTLIVGSWNRSAKAARHARRSLTRASGWLRKQATLHLHRGSRWRATRLRAFRRLSDGWLHRVRRRRVTVDRLAADAKRAWRTLTMDLPGEGRACPACRSPRITLLDPLPLRHALAGCRYGFVSGCRACGLLFANPVRSREDFTAFYSTSGVWAAGQHGRQRSGDVVNAIRSPLAEAGLDVALPPVQAAVLDIGCGESGLLDGLQELGWRTYGIEPAVKSAFVRHQELHEVPEQPTFHLIVLRHVLEHLPDPLEMLQKVQRALVADGCLFLSVPSVDTLPQHRDYRYCISDLPHVSAFTRACLSALLAHAGLRMVSSGNGTSAAPSRARTEVVARNAPATVPPARPLDAAVKALAGYRRANRASLAERWLPVRLRVALLNTNWIALRVPLLSRLDERRAGARVLRLQAEDIRRTIPRRR